VTRPLDTLIYTDCRPDQGLQGTGGLQFQARSAGADREAMAVVQRSLLYEPPTKWMRERRAVADYPRSFAHISDSYLATAAGVYLGTEANGTREGNQLTHSVVTRDREAYGLVRPAQMFRAPFWVTRPAPSTECPPIGGGWQPGPFDAVRAQDFVAAHDRGRELLVALLSALERLGEPQARRVLFIAEDPAAVMDWLTAATLLLPHERALTIGFKVFTTNPAYATQEVVAVHPDWDVSDATVGNDRGYAVFDLVAGDFSQLPPTENAPLWTDLFCAEDPYDVVDAVEVAGAAGLPADISPAVALAAVLRRKPTPAQAPAVVSWLRTGPESLLAAYGASMADLFVSALHDWSPAVLLDLDAVARSRLPDRMTSVRQALIAGEVARARRTGQVAPGKVPPLPVEHWPAAERDRAVDMVVEALHDAPPPGFDAVLRTATRFALPVPVARVHRLAGGFIADWTEHPEHEYRLAEWPCGLELKDLLLDELAARVANSAEEAAAVGDAWWRRLLPGVQRLSSDLDEAVVAAAMLAQPPAERAKLVREFLSPLARAADPASNAQRMAAVLWRRSPATIDELRSLSSQVPASTELEPHLFAELSNHLRTADPLPADLLDLAHELVDPGLMRPDRDVDELLGRDKNLQALCRDLPARQTPEDTVRDLVRAMPPRLVDARAGQLVAALMDGELTCVRQVLAAHPRLLPAYAAGLAEEIRKLGDASRVVAGYYFVTAKPKTTADRLPDEAYRKLDRAIGRWLVWAADAQVKKATDQIDAALGQSWGRAWRITLDKVAKVRRGTQLLRRKGG
jgi:hypothetical protein